MVRIDFIPRRRLEKNPPHRFHALLASCIFHGLAFALLFGAAIYFDSKVRPVTSGSPESVPSISLPTLVIVSTPSPLVPPVQSTPSPLVPLAVSEPQVKAVAPSEPQAKPTPREQGVPVLAVQPSATPAKEPARTSEPTRPAIAHPAPVAMTAPTHAKPAAPAPASSYAPGLNVLPHPPYPPEASNLNETGTVIMNVAFDAKGNVARAEVAQSSGVSVLDSCTQTFIRARWHSAIYAGRSVSVPVEYKLENF